MNGASWARKFNSLYDIMLIINPILLWLPSFWGSGLSLVHFSHVYVCFFRAYYTRKKFRTVYENTMMRSPRLHRNNSSIFHASKNLLQKSYNSSPKSYISQGDTHPKFEFEYPFSELLVSIYILHFFLTLYQCLQCECGDCDNKSL